MKPEEVPDDLVNLAVMVALEHNPDGSREELTRFLADVLPAHEAMVRAEAAENLRDRMAEAITREHYRRAEQRIEASPEEHGRAFADAAADILRGGR